MLFNDRVLKRNVSLCKVGYERGKDKRKGEASDRKKALFGSSRKHTPQSKSPAHLTDDPTPCHPPHRRHRA